MFKLVTVLSTVYLCALDHGQGAASNELMDVPRLPGNTIPLLYVLQFTPNLDKWTFTGIANITVIVHRSTQTVTLNLKDLNVKRVSVMDITNPKSNNQDLVTKYNYLTKKEQMEICLQRTIPKNRILLLTISYTGRIRDDKTGLYKVWRLQNGFMVKWVVKSGFVPTYARRAFPCYDEPIYLAKFNISVVLKNNQTAMSNTRIRYQVKNLENTTVFFFQTPSIPTKEVKIQVGIIYNWAKTAFINHLQPKINLLAAKPDLKAREINNSGINIDRLVNHNILDEPKGSINTNYIKSVVSVKSNISVGFKVLYEFLSTKINNILGQISNLASKMINNYDTKNVNNLKRKQTLRVFVQSSFEEPYKEFEQNIDSSSARISQWRRYNTEIKKMENGNPEKST